MKEMDQDAVEFDLCPSYRILYLSELQWTVWKAFCSIMSGSNLILQLSHLEKEAGLQHYVILIRRRQN